MEATEVAPSAPERRDNSAVLWEIIQTFSPEAQSAAKRKAEELKLALDRGSIPFEETLINLSRNRDVLTAAIEEAALPQLPLKIQTQLIADARKVSSQLTQLSNGTDTILTLESAVDDLTAAIWVSNIQNMSGEILGFHKKQNQLKAWEASLKEVSSRADRFSDKETAAKKLLEEFEQASKSVAGLLTNAQANLQDIEGRLASAKDFEQKASASLAITQQVEKAIANSSANATASAAELESSTTRASAAVIALEKSQADYENLVQGLSAFKQQTESVLGQLKTSVDSESKASEQRVQAEITRSQTAFTDALANLNTTITATLKASTDQFAIETAALAAKADAAEKAREARSSTSLVKSTEAFTAETAEIRDRFEKTLTSLDARTRSFVEASELQTKAKFDEIEKLESIIREKIQLATNYQLFHSFHTRQTDIQKGKEFWRQALIYCVTGSLVCSVLFIISLHWVHQYNAAFFLRLSITIPIIYAIHFCSSQYSKERRLEEEYAFKGNISISLDPYRQLVEKLIDKSDPAEAAKYSKFVIDAVDRVFSSPTQEVLGDEKSKASVANISDLSGGLDKIVKSLTGLVDSVGKIK